jgi:hypothetical protein
VILNKTITLSAALVAVAAMSGLGRLPAVAQYDQPNQYQDRNSQNQYEDRGPPREDRGRGPSNQYDDAYRAGYRAGYDAARNTQRYDDRPEVTAAGRDDPDQRWRQRYLSGT